MNKNIFVTYRTIDEKKMAFQRSLDLRKQWEDAMKQKIESLKKEEMTL